MALFKKENYNIRLEGGASLDISNNRCELNEFSVPDDLTQIRNNKLINSWLGQRCHTEQAALLSHFLTLV